MLTGSKLAGCGKNHAIQGHPEMFNIAPDEQQRSLEHIGETFAVLTAPERSTPTAQRNGSAQRLSAAAERCGSAQAFSAADQHGSSAQQALLFGPADPLIDPQGRGWG